MNDVLHLQVLSYRKLLDDSMLRIMTALSLGFVRTAPDAVNHLYIRIKIDGSECTNPGPMGAIPLIYGSSDPIEYNYPTTSKL